MNDQHEKRQHQRFQIRTHVFVSGEDFSRFKTQTMDFSDGGLFIEGKALANMKIGTIIQVQSAEDMKNPPVLNARIAWSNRYGAGIEYLLEAEESVE